MKPLPELSDSIKVVVDGIITMHAKELAQASEKDLEKYYSFKYNPAEDYLWNFYKFSQSLEAYRFFCREWEELHHGSVCVVERVRDKYLLPKIKQFIDAREAQMKENWKELTAFMKKHVVISPLDKREDWDDLAQEFEEACGLK